MKYSEFRPTACDYAGLGCENRQDWEVAPCTQTRDSGALERSNFAVQLEILGGESDTVEIHRFGHWACGWFEACLVSPERTDAVEEIVCALAGYPVLSDEHFSAEEAVDADASWRACEALNARDQLTEDFDLQPYTLNRVSDEALRDFIESHGVYPEHTDEGASWNVSQLRLNRTQFATWLRGARSKVCA